MVILMAKKSVSKKTAESRKKKQENQSSISESVKSELASKQKKADEETILKKQILDLVEELKKSEAKWKMQRIIVEDDTKILKACEEGIDRDIAELKKASKRLMIIEKVDSGKEFQLKNGKKIFSIAELISELKSAENTIMTQHINETANDFHQWIKDITSNNKLASKIMSAKNPESLLSVLEEEIENFENMPLPAPLKSTSLIQISRWGSKGKTGDAISLSKRLGRNIPPESYFILHNGRAIKNLAEMENELRIADEQTFLYHIGRGKNDFAEWIKNIWGDEKLAEQIKPLKTRKEMIEFLSIFL